MEWLAAAILIVLIILGDIAAYRMGKEAGFGDGFAAGAKAGTKKPSGSPTGGPNPAFNFGGRCVTP